MPKHLTRREFLKDLGLLGAGVGLAPAATRLSPIEEFGEAWSDKAGEIRRPAWVKTVDQPTIEVDWDVMERFNETHTCRAGFAGYVGEDELARLTDVRNQTLQQYLEEGRPGYALRDVALQDAISKRAFGAGAVTTSFLGPQDVPTPDDRGVPRWESTPEENAQVITAAMRHFGAAAVGFVELEADTTEKLIYSHDPDGKEMIIADVDEPAEDDESRTIPRKARWAIVWTVQMSQETLARAPTPLGAQTTTLTYERNNYIQNRLQGFLQGLGYMGLGEASINALGIAPALGTMAGLGEMSRLNRLISPEYGPMIRVFKALTDLPLAPTKPVDAGIMEFCRHCKTCAEYCPSGALSMDTDPTWEVQGEWNNPGHRAFYEDSVACRTYWYEIGTNCGICFAVCPFAQKDRAAIHQMVKSTIATTPILDGTLANLGRFTYLTQPAGEPQKDPDEWWTLDLAEYGIDTSRGHSDA